MSKVGSMLTIPLPPQERSAIQPPEPLQGEQEEKRLKILEHFGASDYKIPCVEGAGELTEQEKFWLTNECLIRYLKASKWDVTAAIQRSEDTLKWRREFGVYDLATEHVEPEVLQSHMCLFAPTKRDHFQAVTGKEIIFGYDVSGRPALYLIPSRQNTNDQTRQIQFTVWMLERCVDLMGPGVGNLALLINFADRAKNPSLGTARKVLNILQSHYPERLGLALIINVPFLVMAFLNLILPFVDPVTREKIKFNPKVIDQGIMDSDQVMQEWGGNIEFEYKHEEYWVELVRLCETRREQWLRTWRALGGKVGIYEWEVKRQGYENGTVQTGEATVNGDV